MTVMDCVGMQPMRIIVIPNVLPTKTGDKKHTADTHCHGLRGYAMQPTRIIVIPIVLPTKTGGRKHTKTHRLKCSLTTTHETKKQANESDSTP